MDALKLGMDQAAREAGTRPGELTVTVAIAGGTARIDRLALERNEEAVDRSDPVYRRVCEAIRAFILSQGPSWDWKENPDVVPIDGEN